MGETPAIKKFQEIPGERTGNQGVGSRTDVGFPGFRKAVVCPAELLEHNGAQSRPQMRTVGPKSRPWAGPAPAPAPQALIASLGLVFIMEMFKII